jgi:TonB family protein
LFIFSKNIILRKIFLRVCLLVVITFASGCFSPPNTRLNTYPKAVYTERGTHSFNGHLGCYFLSQTALTENNNFLLDFKRDHAYTSSGYHCRWGMRLLSIETVPGDGVIQLFGVKNSYIDYPYNWFSVEIKPYAQYINLTIKNTDGLFRKVSFKLKEPMRLAKLEIDNWQTSLNAKEDTNARNTLNPTTNPKPLPPVIQTPKPKPSIIQTEQSAIPNKLKYSGTGFMFSSKDYVITNWHVIRGANNIKVKFLNGEEINAEVLIKDSKNDIAFLKLERSPQLPASSLRVGDSSSVRMGDKVFTIGYPAHWIMGQNPKYTEGVVNSLTGIKDDPTVFQISTQIQPGNSGGPLFNQSGNIIGITQAALDPQLATESIGALPQNVNYAIKSSYIKRLFPTLPETLVSNRGIMVIPTDPKNSLANFIDKAKNNIVLIEASTSELPLPKTSKIRKLNECQGSIKKYCKIISQKVMNARKLYPESARKKGIEGQVTIQFTVLKTGKIKNLKIIKSSNNYFNKTSLETVEQVGPFPGFPKELDKEPLTFQTSFNYELN